MIIKKNFFLPVLRLVLIFMGIVLCMNGNAEIIWLEKEYDFGLIKEEAGPQTGSVRLVNTGPEEIAITGARPSCGCTGVAYPEDPIAPGDTVNFSFTYNPIGRPGRFNKTIRVYVGDSDMFTIRIFGNVLGTPESLSSMYPIEAGPLRLSNRDIPAGEVTYGSTRHFFINGYNQTSDTIRPHWICDNPALSVSSSEAAVAPGDIVTFSFYFNSRDEEEMGPLTIPVTMYADGNADSPETIINFIANVTPDFSNLTPDEVNKAPRCYLAPERLDLGELPESTKNPIKFRFMIKNEGDNDLQVIRIFSRSDAIKISRRPATLKSGKSAEVEGSLNPNKIAQGAFNIKIEVLTNDPLHPTRIIHITGIRET